MRPSRSKAYEVLLLLRWPGSAQAARARPGGHAGPLPEDPAAPADRGAVSGDPEDSDYVWGSWGPRGAAAAQAPGEERKQSQLGEYNTTQSSQGDDAMW